MRERTADKVRRLEHELGRYEKKIADQGKELARVTAERDAGRAGLVEISRAVDALCIDVCLKFGAEVGAGVSEVLLPAVSTDLLRRYELEARSQNDTYCLRATRKE